MVAGSVSIREPNTRLTALRMSIKDLKEEIDSFLDRIRKLNILEKTYEKKCKELNFKIDENQVKIQEI